MRLGRIARISLILLAFAAAPAAAQTPPACGGLPATIVGTEGNDQLRGTAGNDVIVGLGGNDVIRGEGGHDVICGGPGNDTLFGGSGNDRLIGGDGNDSIHAGEGDDFLDGAGGKNNTLHGDEGWDTCINGKPHKCEDDGTTQNTAPVAHAGPDQTTPVNTTVTLDGTGSTDADGDSITYLWTLTSIPAGSNAVLSDPAAARPALMIDRAGTYIVQLIVSDGSLESEPDSVQIATTNSPPVAHAGAGQTARVGDTVALNGSQSSDVDGDPITYRWTLLSTPDGSSAALADATTVTPAFVVDRPGAYVAELIVNDGLADSEPDTVTVVTTNSAPVAHAGPDQSAPVSATVTLDGSGSTDVDGNALTYLWSLTSVPAGSLAALSSATAVAPTFTIDLPGVYVAQLVVNDGTTSSVADTVAITTSNSAPVADAGEDQSAVVGAVVTLSGAGSSDADGDPLAFHWSLISVPDGSLAALTDATAINPAFTIDRPGHYVAQLVVSDGSVDSAPDTVTVTTANSAPIADAGADRSAHLHEPITLDGSASRDADFNPLTYRWSFTSRPPGSTATLLDDTTPAPSFTPDAHGTFIAQLIVNDGTVDSAPDTITITTLNTPPTADAGPAQTVDAGDTVTLSGSGTDADGDTVTLHWTLDTVPAGSTAVLSDPSAATPTFVADRAGTYVARLTANDSQADSDPSFVSIEARPPQLQLVVVNNALLGVGRSTPVQVVLPRPAPADVTVTITSDPLNGVSIAPGSVLIPAGGSSAEVTVTGVTPGPVILTGSAPDYRDGSVALTVTDKLVTLADGFAVPLGQQGGLTVSISPLPAPPSGTVIQLTTSDENVIAVSASVTILPGQFSATAIVTGVRPGTAIVTATNPDFATDTASVSTSAQLNITAGAITFAGGFTGSITVQLLSGGAPVPAPSPGIPLTLTSANPACAVAQTPSPNLATGLSQLTTPLAYGGTATLPCTTTVTASSPSVTSDSITVTVNPKPILTLNADLPTTIGSGQMSFNLRSFLAIGTHGGATVTIASSDPNVLVSPNTSTVGTPSIVVNVPNGSTQVNFIAHALEGFTGSATITASEPRFTSATGTVTVVQPAIQFNGLAGSSIDTLDPNRSFTVLYGIPAATGVSSRSIRAGGATVNVTITSGTPAVADLVFGATTAASVIVPITAGSSQSANVQFHPIAVGQTTVTMAAPGVITTPLGSALMTVTTPTIALTPDLPQTIGSGQMTVSLRAFLSASNHGGGVVTIASNNPGVLVSPNTSTAGTPSIQITLPLNATQVNFVAHAVEGFVGSAAITVSEPRFTSGTGSVTVVQPAIVLNGLAGSPIDTLDPNRSFTVLYGIPAGNSVSSRNIRAGGATVNVTITSSNPAIGDLVSGAATGATVTTSITPGSAQSATVQFHPIAAGQTTVSMAAPGVITQPLGSALMTVTTPTIALTPDLPQTIGSGQMTVSLRVFLSASNHGGGVVTIASNNPGVLVSPNTSTAGTPSIQINLPLNATQVNFVAHAVEGFVGSATITASEPRFTSGTGTVTVVQPAIVLNGLAGSTIDTLDPNRTFTVLYGIPSGNSVSSRNVRAGGATVNVTVTSSNPAVADLVSGAATGASVMASITPGSSQSANLQFHPIAAGQTTVTIAAPGVITQPLGTALMTVTTPVISLVSALPVTVGAGLQSGFRQLVLGASNHGGTVVRVESSNPLIALVSPNTTTAGSAFILLTVPNGQTQVSFVVQGVEGADGNVVITASTPRFSDGQGTARVVPAAVQLNGVNPTATAGGPDDPFVVLVGIPNADGSALAETQPVRGGGQLVVTVTSSAPAIAGLVSGATTTGSVAVTIGANQAGSPNVFWRPLSAGTSSIAASAPGVITTGLGVVTVTVNP